jgi:Meckel syndrome type 1 protein
VLDTTTAVAAVTGEPTDQQAKAKTQNDLPAPTPAQPADAAIPQAATPQAIHAAAAAQGGAQTVANLAAQILKKLDAKTTRFDVELDPAGLGKVNVRIDIGADGQMSAALNCHNPQATEVLKGRSEDLRQALAQAGFDLSGGLSFETGSGGQGGGAGAGQGQGQSEMGAAFRGRAFASALDAGESDAVAQAALRLNRSRDTGVDIRI